MTEASSIPSDVLDRIRDIVGDKGAITDLDTMAPLLKSWRDNWLGRVPMVVQPANTHELAAVIKHCYETDTPLVPQGGNTGLTGASQPHDNNSEIIVSTSRMNAIREIDVDNDTITVEAGCILANIQEAAARVDRLFPLSLAAEGSCQIGGNLSTNAGGTQVVRYGNARALVLGLEVVLPDGRVWDGLRALRKDNTGYDLKQLFIGGEGTLGMITAAVLKLYPRPSDVQTALIALPSPAAAVAFLGRARARVGEQISVFELIQRRAIDFALDHMHGVVDPFAENHPWYVLTDIAGQGTPGTLSGDVENLLEQAMEAGEILDAVLASSDAQAQALWHIRESIPEAQNFEGASIKHDVSVPVSRVPEFITRASAVLEANYPDIRIVAFGHLGDGNIHFNPAQPKGAKNFYSEREAINRIVHDLIAEMNGSISAEHGIGRLRLAEAEIYKSSVELDLMRTIKKAIDPKNIMNPGKTIRV
jgi:FAD/FMN-containing dehydrogenase